MLDKLSLQVNLILHSKSDLAKLEKNFEVGEELDHFRSSAGLGDCCKECSLDTIHGLVDLISNFLDELFIKGGGVALLDLSLENDLIREELDSLNCVSSVIVCTDKLTDLVEDLSGSWASRACSSCHYFLDKLYGIFIAGFELLSQLLVQSGQHNLYVSDLIFLVNFLLIDFVFCVAHLF